MKVLHINTFDFGGAATACKRIHLELLKNGVDSKILLLHKTKNIPETYQFNLFQKNKSFFIRQLYKLYSKIENRLKRAKEFDFNERKRGVVYFSFPTSPYDITEHPLYKEADIIQLNWVSGFLDEPSFFEKNTKPVIWRMADLYAGGGGNHYETDCPFDKIKPEMEANLKIRKEALKGANIIFVAISNWVKEKANSSVLIEKFPKAVIHNGVDMSIFKPHNKVFARQVFNIPEEKIILLFGLDYDHRIKGKDILLNALNALNIKNIQLVTFGKSIIEEKLVQYPILNIGTINDERLLSVLYSAADYFIMPSIEEAFGQVTIEALASGTPVISLPNGGSLDIIIDGVNGVLANGFEPIDLKQAIEKALSILFQRNIIIEDTKKRFNIKDKANEYLSLYKKVLNK